MKKVLLIAAVLTVGFIKSNAQVKLGVHASGILASAKQTEEEDGESITIKHKSRASWKAGVSADIPVSENFSIVPQLNILSKGGKPGYSYSFEDMGFDYSIKLDGEMKLTYLELPVNFMYKSNGFMVGAGPSISMG